MPDNGHIYAYLAAVGDYRDVGCSDLPSWKNDLELICQGLTNGLRLHEENIRVAGNNGYASIEEFASAMTDYRDKLAENDVLIIYFSGHGKGGQITFSNGSLLLQDMINYVSKLPVRGKVVILDCCFAGVAEAGPPKVMLPEDTMDQFVGHGIAIMASASAGETARMGIPPNHSLYTAVLSATMQMPHLIRKGQISLHDLNREVCALVDEWNDHHPERRQSPVFRASMGGTIFFPVTDWRDRRKAYVKQFYDGYEIFDEQDLSTNLYKRVAVFVRTDEESEEDLVPITREVIGQHGDCHVVWCYFGHDVSDMLRHVFFAYTIWASDEENRSIHFKNGKDRKVLDDICICRNAAYNMVREIQKSDLTEEEYREKMVTMRAELLTIAESMIAEMQEVENGTISLNTFKNNKKNERLKVKQLYNLLSEMPPAMDSIYEWAESMQEVAGWILDIVLYVESCDETFDDRYRWLVTESLRSYQNSLSGYSSKDKEINNVTLRENQDLRQNS